MMQRVLLASSIPIGDLAKKDLDSESAGWAESGAVFDISFAYKRGESNFGLTALLRGQAYLSDAQAMADDFAKTNAGINWTVESTGWGIGGFMFGGFGAFPISEKATFDPRAMVGFMSTTSPEYTITASDASGSAWMKQGTATASSFAYLVGVGFKFEIGEKLYLLTNLDYVGTEPEFSGVEITSSDGTRVTDTIS